MAKPLCGDLDDCTTPAGPAGDRSPVDTGVGAFLCNQAIDRMPARNRTNVLNPYSYQTANVFCFASNTASYTRCDNFAAPGIIQAGRTGAALPSAILSCKSVSTSNL
ncbi:hypothetical protein [Bradyrhizobium sp.]|uniref:hypothetical protein n=1 Tax=Bradyrhizobium sp. TaxID=376 RepID=UPI003C6B3A45